MLGTLLLGAETASALLRRLHVLSDPDVVGL
jgi:hypothetical protein